MSRENVEVIRRMWDAFLAGDIQAALSFYDPDVEWDGTNLPDGRIGRGHEAIVDHIRRWAEQWEDWTVEVERIIDGGSEHVVLVMRERGRSNSGLEMDERHAELYAVHGGKVVRRQGFSNPGEALDAVGLPEWA
jgi:ketosteroid isomerase-like protein